MTELHASRVDIVATPRGPVYHAVCQCGWIGTRYWDDDQDANDEAIVHIQEER